MHPEQVEGLRRQYTDQYVEVAGQQPALARFRGLVGQVKTVNLSGLALVQFDANGDRAWYDLAVSDLKVVDKPAPKVVEKKPPPPVKPKPAAEKPAAEKPAQEPAAGE